MVVSDPKYGIGVKPENVIGVTMVLKDEKSKMITTARKQIKMGHFFDDVYTREFHYNQILTSYLWTPATWYVGKVGGIMNYIHPFKKPIMVAGDSPNDHWMLFYSDVEIDGIRLWVNRKEKYMKKTNNAIKSRLSEQNKLGVKPIADKGWIIVTPKDIL